MSPRTRSRSSIPRRTTWLARWRTWAAARFDRRRRGLVWVANEDEQSLARIDSTTLGVDRTPLELTPTGVAVGAGAVWVAHGILGSVSRVGVDGSVLETIDDVAPRSSDGSIAVGEGAVWFVSANGVIAEIDPRTNQVVQTDVAGSLPSGVDTGFDGVWVANAGENNVVKINPRTVGIVETDRRRGKPERDRRRRSRRVGDEQGRRLRVADRRRLGLGEDDPGRRRADGHRVRRGRRLGGEHRRRDGVSHRSGDGRGRRDDRNREPPRRDRRRRRKRLGDGPGARYDLRQTAAKSKYGLTTTQLVRSETRVRTLS